MGRRRSREDLRNISQMDVTPLVDLTFLLLIVFMITAPALEYAVDVSPPSYTAAEIKPDENKVVTLTQSGQYLLGTAPMPRDLLRQELARLFQRSPKTDIYIRADARRQYGEVMNLMKLVKGTGFSEVSLVTQEDEP